MKFNSALAAALSLLALAAQAQPTAFTYQGQLNDGTNPATGVYDFRFQVYDGSSLVVGGPETNAPVGVTNGLFTATLDFGDGVFDGGFRTLEIGVRSYGDTNAYAVLAPRQPILSVPYAIQSINASNAMNLTAPLSATNITGTIPDTRLSTNVALLNGNVTFSGSVAATGFSGDGAGLVNVPSTVLTGTIPDARLSTNVAFLNTNANFSTNVNAVLFTGSGHGLTNVPGAFFWIIPSGTNTGAQSNVGYILTNEVAPFIITLPSSPSMGDVFRVAGVGAAGWIIAQNTNQTILAGNISDGIGQSWTARDASRNWSSVASSADGTKLVATEKGGKIYTSTNSGATWTARDSTRNWSSVASSADGTKLVAAVGDNASQTGNIYTSTDSGASWTSRDHARQWTAVASSADGTKLVAVAYGTGGSGNPGIYTSTDSGMNWTLRNSGSFGIAAASSANGSKLAVAVTGAAIVTSTNSGTSWTAHATALSWTSVASSADGTRLVAVASGGQTFVSADSGVTWTASNPSALSTWSSAASSADGSRLAAAATSGEIYVSTDSGATWAQRSGAPAGSWSAIASSANGSKLVAVVNGGFIYTSGQGGTTSGTGGYLSGAPQSAMDLIYVGNGTFMPLSHEGTIRAF